jgi:hypothetical protein
MIGRIIRDQHDAGDPADAVGVLLEGRVPEILGVKILASRKARVRCPDVAREGERKAELDRRAVGPPALALEGHGVGGGDTGAAERGRVSARIAAFEEQHRQALAVSEERLVKPAEQGGEPVGSQFFRLGHGQQLDEEAGKLNDVIVGASRMAIARPNREAELAMELGSGVEIAHGVDDVIETAGHRRCAYVT